VRLSNFNYLRIISIALIRQMPLYIPLTKVLVKPHPGIGRIIEGGYSTDACNLTFRARQRRVGNLIRVHLALGILSPCGLDKTMQDFWMLFFTVVFFVLAFSYVHACQKLR